MSVLFSEKESAQNARRADAASRWLGALLDTYTASVRPAPPPRRLRLSDLPAALDVKVTEEDILLGVRRDQLQCPRVRAIKRYLALTYGEAGRNVGVRVGKDIRLTVQSGAYHVYDQSARDIWGLAIYDVFGRMQPHTLHAVRDDYDH